MTGDQPHTTVVDDLEDREIRFLGDVQRLTLEPDDILVIRSPERLPVEACSRLAERARELVGKDRRVLILDGGLEIGVLAPTTAEG